MTTDRIIDLRNKAVHARQLASVTHDRALEIELHQVADSLEAQANELEAAVARMPIPPSGRSSS